MFSSFDPRGSTRNNNGVSRFFPNAPRGFSVHVFKNSSLPSQPPPAPMAPVSAPPKFDASTVQSRSSNGSSQWSRQQSYRPPQHDSSERKLLLPAVGPTQDRRIVQVPALNTTWPVDTKFSKSQKSYGIYPSLTSDIYIYERSITSASYDDELASSPSSDSSSSDSDHFPRTATFASLEISSTRASSSTETLESTLMAPAPGTHPNVLASVPPPLAITAPPHPPSTRPQHDAAPTTRPVIPITHQSQLQRSISVSRVVPPIPLASAPLDNLSDSSDSDTAVSETHADTMVVDMLGAPWSGPSNYYPGRSATPFGSRRDSADRVPSNSYRRDAPSLPPLPRDPPMPMARPAPAPSQRSQHRDDSPRTDDPAHPRAPPGLSGGVATPVDGSLPRRTNEPPSSSSANNSPTSRSAASASAVALARTTSTRTGPANSFPGPQAPSIPPAIFAPTPTTLTSAAPPHRDTRTPSPQSTSPQRGAPGAARAPSPTHGNPPFAISGPGLLITIPKRNVRWNDNLVCPSPIPPEHRRKGWFNRRGDQLWTNDGQFKVPAPGQEFPPDLAHYPEPNTGWMNEEGVRIDVQHRLIPKLPLRSALKRRTS